MIEATDSIAVRIHQSIRSACAGSIRVVASSGNNATTVVAISTVAAPPAKGRPYVVGMKRREVGLRLALGAARPSVLRHFVSPEFGKVQAPVPGGVGVHRAAAA